MQKRHRKGLLWCFATLAGVTVVGSSRVHVRYNPCRKKTEERFAVLFCDTGGCYGRGVLLCTCEV